MVRYSSDRVRLAPADWGGLCSLALAILTLVGATLWNVWDLSTTSRERLARVEAELAHLQADVSLLKSDVRVLTGRGRP
ncbi:hypothetical protein Pla111_15990 [Botrimarina hoheduenensis]|uniref:Uncharacterized protein n=1 Tax=Botrimarina hoheduenensis TaxID=2528000 RepID=A0A5C5W8C0_9BACT|nr:hypothetical protein Pla111_15990 [Botrimarina hoheduenensis]